MTRPHTPGWGLPYPSRREPALGLDVVATSQPLAVQAGMAMYERGGNAVDAAIAAAITLTVVEPTSNGIGGDAFAIVAHEDHLLGLDASGRAPAGIDLDRLTQMEAMPVFGWDPVTVPGAVSAWQALHERLGRLEFSDLFGPAVRHAREGFPVSPLTASAWARAEQAYKGQESFAAAFLPGGRAPRAGERFAHPDQAATLEKIAATGGASFYEGELAARIAGEAARGGGALSAEDLADHAPTWVEPIAVDYHGATVHEIPPAGQGIAALLGLAVLERLGIPPGVPNTADAIHLEVEAMKVAFAETARHVGDPTTMQISADAMLHPDRIERLAAAVDPERAGDPGPGVAEQGGTVYLVAADRDGMMVSYIQSNYMGFGSGVVVPGTGIAMHNRGAGFVTRPDHPNAVGPHKRPFHTIIPGFLTHGGSPVAAFGVMGGPMQPQGHIQLMRRILDADESPQAALDAPRWRVAGGAGTGLGGMSDGPWTLHLEGGIGGDVAADLDARGHDVRREERWDPGFGGGQIAWRLPDGAYLAASDPRKDGHAAAR